MKHTMSNTPEANVKKAIDKLLKAYEFIIVDRYTSDYTGEWSFPTPKSHAEQYKIMWWYKPQAGTYGRSGVPDYIGCISGRMFGIEAKANGNTLTTLQRNQLTQIHKAGGEIFVINGITEDRQITLNHVYMELEGWLKEQHAAFKARQIMGIQNV